MFDDESVLAFPKKEIAGIRKKEREKLGKRCSGVSRKMGDLPGAVFVGRPQEGRQSQFGRQESSVYPW